MKTKITKIMYIKLYEMESYHVNPYRVDHSDYRSLLFDNLGLQSPEQNSCFH